MMPDTVDSGRCRIAEMFRSGRPVCESATAAPRRPMPTSAPRRGMFAGFGGGMVMVAVSGLGAEVVMGGGGGGGSRWWW